MCRTRATAVGSALARSRSGSICCAAAAATTTTTMGFAGREDEGKFGCNLNSLCLHTWLPVRLLVYVWFTLETLTRAPTHPYEHMHACKPYPKEYLRRLGRQILKIDEVTTSASLSTGTSPTTESTNADKS
jgi:hypothetical protein